MIKKHKRALSFVLTFVLLFVSASVTVPVATALTGTTNKTANVYSAPYDTTGHIRETVPANKMITVIDREYNFLRVNYDDGTVTKSGYIKISDINASGYQYHVYTHYESAKNITGQSIYVYYCPDGENVFRILDPDEGIVYNKLLTVLNQQNGYSFVQYVMNYNNDGTSTVIYERGWVKTTDIAIVPRTSAVVSYANSRFYIKNVATGLYLDLASYSIADGANIHIWDYHGGYNQEWILQPIETDYGSTYVRLLTNMASAQNKTVRVTTGTAINNDGIDLGTISSLRSQEFYFQPTTDGYYYIRSRCGQNYMMLGIDPNDSGVGGDVLLRFPTSSLYNKWIVEPAYEEGIDFVYKPPTVSHGFILKSKINSTVPEGVTAKYNITSVSRNAAVNGQMLNFTTLTNEALNSCVSERIVLQANSTSVSTVTWQQTGGYYIEDGERKVKYGDAQICHQITDGEYSYSYVKINIYIDTIYDYCDKVVSFSDFSNVWKSVLVHELCHSLGLDDTNENNTGSIMCDERYRPMLFTPQKMDFSGIKKNYSPQK